MSATTEQPAPPTTAPRNEAITISRNLPELVHNLATADPALAEQLKGKAAVFSRSMYATPIAMGVSWLVSKYGLGWDAETQALAVFGIGTVGTWIMRYVSVSPITGFFRATLPAPSEPAKGPTP